MAYEKMKEEAYQNLKGINVKTSDYATSEIELLDLRNYTFVKPGSWTSRPGTGVHLSLAVSGYSTKPNNYIEFTKDDGASYQIFDSGSTLHYFPGPVAMDASLSVGNSGIISGVAYENQFYYANGSVFRGWNTSGLRDINMPVQTLAYDAGFGGTIVGATFNTSLASGVGVTTVITPGLYAFFPGNARNYSLGTGIYTQPQVRDDYADFGSAVGVQVNATIATAPNLGQWVVYGATFINPLSGVSLWYIGKLGYSLYISPGSTTINSTLMSIGLSTFGGAATLGFFAFDNFSSGIIYEQQEYLGILPKHLSIYNNMMFASNITVSAALYADNASKSRSYVYEIGNPDKVLSENSFDIVTDDGDEITGTEFFQDSLIYFKNKSVHEVNGTDPTSLTLRELTRQYGCPNNRAVAVYNNRMWFVSNQGEIIEYNGANFRSVSEPIYSYLGGLDFANARAIHVKKMNQVWFGMSNKVFAFDYHLEAWTIYDNINIDQFSGANVVSYGATIKDVSWWESGASYHNLVRFNDSLNTDQGAGITLKIKTRFHKRHGDTTQELFRRLFIDADIPGSTQGVTINLYPDWGTSIYSSRSAYLDDFQKRLDFGVSAKSLSVEILAKATQQVRINGYTIESRFLRKV